MKDTQRGLIRAFDLVHDFDNGTFELSKTGDLEHGEEWTAIFRVGYGRRQVRGVGKSPAYAISAAAQQIKGCPKIEAKFR